MVGVGETKYFGGASGTGACRVGNRQKSYAPNVE